MTQPTFLPVTAAGEVRPTTPSETPELGRTQKAGLQRSAHPPTGASFGSQAPGGGFALTIANREIAKLTFEHDHDRHDVELGVALVAEKRASLIGRGPTLADVHVAMDVFGLRTAPVVDHHLVAPFSGLAHSYVLQRHLVDAVTSAQLVPGPDGTTFTSN